MKYLSIFALLILSMVAKDNTQMAIFIAAMFVVLAIPGEKKE